MASWIIEGVTEDGRRFRPSDWVERLSDASASFGPDQRLRYGLVSPCYIDGRKCLRVKKILEQENPEALKFVWEFVLSNRLRMTEMESLDAIA